MDNGLCDFECPGYERRPRPGHLWPSEAPAQPPREGK